MAFVNLSGVLTNPIGGFDVGGILKMTHLTTTGDTLSSTVTELIIPPNGAYDIDLNFGVVRFDYTTEFTQNFIAITTVNGDTTATTIPELLNAVVPPTNAQLLLFQDILADAVTAETNAAASAASAASNADDTVISQTELSVALANTDTSIMVISRALDLKERTAGSGGGAIWDVFASGTFTVGAAIWDVFDHDTLPLQLKLRNDKGLLSLESIGAVVSTDSTSAIAAAIALQESTGVTLTTESAGEYIYNAIPPNKIDFIGEGKVVRITGSAAWWAFESTNPVLGKILNNESRDTFRSLIAQSARETVADVTYIMVGDSTRASNNQVVYKGMRNNLLSANIETVLSAKSGQTANDWGNSTGTGVKWDDLLGANASTYDAIPGTGSTTLVDICLGINDTSNDTVVADITAIKADIKMGIDGLIAARADLLVNLTQPNRLRNQPLKTSKLIQVMKELSEENNWSMTNTVAGTIPTNTDAFNRSDLYVNDTHPNDEGQSLILRVLINHVIGDDYRATELTPNSPKRLTQSDHAYSQNIEDAFEYIHAALNNGWDQIQIWRFDADTWFFTIPDGSSSSSRSFKPDSNTETIFPADNGPNLIRIYDSSPPIGGGTWTRTRAFTYKIRDMAALTAIPIGEKIPLNPAIISPYPSNPFVTRDKVKSPREILDTFFVGKPTNGQIVARKRMTKNAKLGFSFKVSGGTARVASTGTAIFTIKKNGAQIGFITFTSSGEATFASNPFAIVDLVVGDLLDIAAPLTADATLEDIGITLFAVDTE